MKMRLGLLVFLLVGISMVIVQCTKKREKALSSISDKNDVVALFALTPQELTSRVEKALADAQKGIDAIISIPPKKRTFANTARSFDGVAAYFDVSILFNTVQVLEVTHPDEAIRNAAHDATLKIHSFFIDSIANNYSLYKALKEYAEGNAKKELLSDEEWYFLDETIKDFKLSGLELPEAQRFKASELKKELAGYALDFEKNIAQDLVSLTLSHEELKGLDAAIIKGFTKNEAGEYVVAVTMPNYMQVMKHCSVAATRKKMASAWTNRAYPANEGLLKKIIAKRDELAHVLGFESYADYDTASQMAGSSSNAQALIDELLKKSQPKEDAEFKLLAADLPEAVCLTADGQFDSCDSMYARTQYKLKHFKLDDNEVARYFPTEKTIDRLLNLYATFFGITFEQVPVKGLWHEDVRLIKVSDNGQLLGYLLLDLYPRPNKYTHAAHCTVIPSVYDEQGKPAASVSVVLANFPKATVERPSLLQHDDATTFFHEFGHAMHGLLGRTKLASCSGTSVKNDFVEVPSQMFEEWLWDKDILKQVSCHYTTGEPLPDNLIDTMIALKNFDSGAFVQRQSVLAKTALDYFKNGADKDPYQIMEQLNKEFVPNIAYSNDNHMYASWGHLTGYGAKYYSYMWSKVFALDLFNEIKKHGLTNPAMGKKLIKDVLGKGGSADPRELLRAFLGREPSLDAFMHDLGLQ